MSLNKTTSKQKIPLDDLLALLKPSSIRASINGNFLIAQHHNYKVQLEVITPKIRQSENGLIKAVILITSEIPTQLLSIFEESLIKNLSTFNRFASLGSLIKNDKVCIASRLTIYEDENAWETLHLPVLLFTIVGGSEAILGKISKGISGEPPKRTKSQWSNNNFLQVEKLLSQICICTSSDLSLTAQFALENEKVGAGLRNHKTALFRMLGNQPHPVLGDGLLNILEMPHQVSGQNNLYKVCNELNKMEINTFDLPPHFGAWCPGSIENNPAYVSFYPNAMHTISGITVNSAIWAVNRAEYASKFLETLGYKV